MRLVLFKRNRILRCNFIQPVFWVAALFVFFLAQDVSARSNHVVTDKVERTSHSNSQAQLPAKSIFLPQRSNETDPFCCHTDDMGVTCSSGPNRSVNCIWFLSWFKRI